LTAAEIKFLPPERTYSSLRIGDNPVAYCGLKIITSLRFVSLIFSEGMERGLEQGLEKGKVEVTQQIILKLAGEDMPIEMIMVVTGLTKVKIEQILGKVIRKVNSCKMQDLTIIENQYTMYKNKKKFFGIRKKVAPLQSSSKHTSAELDSDFYSQYYSDLSAMSEGELIHHWKEHGKTEGRIPSFEQMLKQIGIEHAVEIDFKKVDADFYLALYPDLRKNGIQTQLQATSHFYKTGKKEERFPCYVDWLRAKGLDVKSFTESTLTTLVQSFVRNINANELQGLLDIISAEKVQPIKLAKIPKKTALIYRELANKYTISGNYEKGLILFRTSLVFYHDAQTYESIGNIYLDNNNRLAIKYYEKSLQLQPDLFCSAYNKINAYKEINDYSNAFHALTKALTYQLNKTQFLDLLDELCTDFWQDQQSLANLLVDESDRQGLIELNKASSETMYQAYLNAAGQTENPPLTAINAERILIVGDYHVPQCIRYRIDQKVEQLELAGKKVTELDWTQLDKAKHEQATHDVVIFYRVPSVPQVLKAMAQTNAAGKLSIYEIDDLLFDEAYPPPLETYGGYVDMHTYQELSKGMGLFNSAARFCRIGLASTIPLTKHLEKLVFGHQCLLHRNGLDSLNKFKLMDKSHKQTIDIFYGSGTQAHNSDFIELALPAIERVLEENKQIRFIVAGYLQLPQSFMLKFKEQYRQIPPIKKVQNYWSLLELADINIAVLHDDEINNCKSELKWFEAACFSIPSIVSNTQNYHDVIRHDEDGYIVSSSEEWYQALHKLASNPQKRHEIGQAAMQRVKEEYSLQALGSQLVENLDQYLLEQTKQLASKPRKKIALVNVFFAPQSIGGATRVVEDNFDVLIDQYKDEYELCVFTADAECRTPHQMTVYNHKGARVYRTTSLWRENMDWHAKDPAMYDVFSEFLADEQPDLVHFHCVQRLTASIVEATRDLEIPYIITAHDAWWISDYQFLVDAQDKVYEQGHPDIFEPIQLPANITMDESIDRRQYLKSLLHDAKQVLTVSEAFAAIYRKNGVANIAVTKNGFSSHIDWNSKETSHTDKVICAHISGMSAHKGYDMLQKSVIEAQPKNLEFLIVDHSKEGGYESHETWGDVPVTFIGRAKQNDIVKLYQKIDVLFAPSIWPESFGLVTREAAACGCWVVASNLGGIGEDVLEGENGFVIEPTQEALESILDKLSSNPREFKQLAINKKIAKVEEQVKELVEYL